MSDATFLPDAAMLQSRGTTQAAWMDRAADTARKHFGRQVFVRGVIEISNFCRENCAYCGMRRENRSLHRYRAEVDQLAELLLHHRPASITDLNLQAGEDPVAAREVALPLLRILQRETSLGLSVCLGTLDERLYAELQAAGASIYILKFEVADARRYAELQSPGSLSERIEHIRLLAREGWKVSSGFIAGLPGQTETDLLENVILANSLPLAGCSVSPFVPGDETPLAAAPAASIEATLNCMAALRLIQPDWVIPAVSALNLAEPGAGYQRGLRAGANLVTINLTPSEVRDDYLLYKRERFIMTEDRILAALESEGLAPSRTSLASFYQRVPHVPSIATAAV